MMKKCFILFIILFQVGCFTAMDQAKNKGGQASVSQEIEADASGKIVKRLTNLDINQSDNPEKGIQFSVEPDGTVKGSSGSTFENKMGSVLARFKSIQPFYWTGIACLGIGCFILMGINVLPTGGVGFSNKIGWACIVFGLVCILFGTVLPNIAGLLTYVTIGVAVGGGAYYLIRSHKIIGG